jgi:uncharacterized protein with von Willebrand factor type A (vWA) domain
MVVTNWDRFTVENDPFDVMAFQGVFKQSKTLQDTLSPKKLVTAKELGQDVFDSLYKYVPKVKPETDIDPSYIYNKALVDKAMGTQEYERLRAVTRLADMESALATEIISKELLENIPEEDKQAVNDYAKAQANLSNALAKLKALTELGKLTPGLKAYQTKLKKQLAGLQQAAQQATPTFQQACQNPQVMAALRAAIGSAVDELGMANDFAGGWGLGPGQLVKVNAKDRLELMRRITGSQKIRELQKLLGRMKRLAFQKRYNRPTTEPNEVTDITRGDDLARIVPSELIDLAMPEREELFYTKFINKELLVYELKGRETYGRGPIIILIDNSGSMGASEGGISREMWAKGMGLAMAEIALKDKRDIEFINFSSRSEQSKHVVSHTLDPAKRIEALIEVAEEFYGGGTDFEAPLATAFADVEASQFKKADIVLVTDGDCEISDEFAKKLEELKAEKKTRLHTVVIGSHSASMEHVSDTYSSLYDILTDGDEAAGKLFESV